MVTINQLVELVAKVRNKKVSIKYVDGPTGVRGRNSNNDLIRKNLNWNYHLPLQEGIAITYNWINEQIKESLV
jgi:nucleoside-diphosphate-sugar epimerase